MLGWSGGVSFSGGDFAFYRDFLNKGASEDLLVQKMDQRGFYYSVGFIILCEPLTRGSPRR